MRDAASELANGVHLLRLRELLLEMPSFADIADDAECRRPPVDRQRHAERLDVDRLAVEAHET